MDTDLAHVVIFDGSRHALGGPPIAFVAMRPSAALCALLVGLQDEGPRSGLVAALNTLLCAPAYSRAEGVAAHAVLQDHPSGATPADLAALQEIAIGALADYYPVTVAATTVDVSVETGLFLSSVGNDPSSRVLVDFDNGQIVRSASSVAARPLAPDLVLHVPGAFTLELASPTSLKLAIL